MASGGEDRKNAMKHQSTANKLRDDIRREFRRRIRIRRAQLTDAQRLFSDEYCLRDDINLVLQEIIRQFEQVEAGSSVGVLETLEQMKDELYEEQMRFETEQHAAGVQRELDLIVQNLFTCRVCDELVPPEKEVCDRCSHSHFNGH